MESEVCRFELEEDLHRVLEALGVYFKEVGEEPRLYTPTTARGVTKNRT